MDQYHKVVGDISASLLKWADPEGRMVKSPTRTWFLSDLDSALVIAALYLVVVFAGSVRQTRERRRQWCT